jgi:hypothetical protein
MSAMKLLGLTTLFAAGVLFAGIAATVGGAQTIETATETVHETTTQTLTQTVTHPPTTTTVRETTTVQQTTTAPATTVTTTETQVTTTTPPVTTSSAASSSSTPAWVWVLLALLGAAVIGLAVVLFTRRSTTIPDSERRQRLQAAVAGWTAQGWAVLTETADTAMLQRGDERMSVSVDQTGQTSAHLVTPQPPASPGRTDPNAPTERIDPPDPWDTP